MVDKEDEPKIEFDSAGQAIAYMSFDQAVLRARLLARQHDDKYRERLGWDEIVWAELAAEPREDSYRVVLQFRRPTRQLQEEQTGQEEFIFDPLGNLLDRQVLAWPVAVSGSPVGSTQGAGVGTTIAAANLPSWLPRMSPALGGLAKITHPVVSIVGAGLAVLLGAVGLGEATWGLVERFIHAAGFWYSPPLVVVVAALAEAAISATTGALLAVLLAVIRRHERGLLASAITGVYVGGAVGAAAGAAAQWYFQLAGGWPHPTSMWEVNASVGAFVGGLISFSALKGPPADLSASG